jgi:mono/diheme cytochrome c family protein
MKRYFILAAILSLVGCSDPSEDAVQKAPIEVTSKGENIYMLYCASCHGPSGDGVGFIELDRPARSFVDGGFSFGNTLHAISKTTASGIPGTPMPPFVDILSEEQIKLVSMFVRSFAPSLKEATPDETEMVVIDKPLVVRGMIPPIRDGLPLHPRGLVIGNPDRFSYEYVADDVRLLTIRQGNFVLREDWGERGGSPLQLLGSIVITVEDGAPYQLFSLQDNTPLRAQLTSTNTIGEYGVIRYSLLTPEGRSVAEVEERCVPTTGTRTLIEQQFSIRTTEPIVIHPPSSTDTSDAPLIPVGEHAFIITHAIYTGGTVNFGGSSEDSSGGSSGGGSP